MRFRAAVASCAGASALSMVLVLAACAGKPRCEPIEHCDVRTRACQRAALQHAVCLRGRDESAELDVSVVTLDRSDYLDEVRQAADDESEAKQQMRSGLALFRLAAPPSERADARASRARLVGGFYESDERQVTLIDHGGAWSSGGNVLLLVHELLHALQDAAGELDTQPPPLTLDQALARSALVEGEATILSDEAGTEGYGFAFRDLDYTRALTSYRVRALASIAGSDSPFDVASMRFPYAFGASYLWPLRREQGAGALAEAYSAPPVSTYAAMNGDPEQSTLRENVLGELAAPVLPELTRVGCYHLGRFLYEARRRATYLDLPQGADFVADTLCVFVDAEASVSATWRIRFASEKAAALATDANPAEGELSWSRTGHAGTDVWWSAGFGAPHPEDVSWQSAPAQDFGFAEEEPAAQRIHCLRRGLGGEAPP